MQQQLIQNVQFSSLPFLPTARRSGTFFAFPIFSSQRKPRCTASAARVFSRFLRSTRCRQHHRRPPVRCQAWMWIVRFLFARKMGERAAAIPFRPPVAPKRFSAFLNTLQRILAAGSPRACRGRKRAALDV